jgi:hypothetical protein
MTHLYLCTTRHRLKRAALGLVGILALSGPANAACNWTFVNGRQAALCDNAMDMPGLRPLGLAPMVPPSLPPMQPLGLPPLGTTSCHQAQVWNGVSYQWQSVCR